MCRTYLRVRLHHNLKLRQFVISASYLFGLLKAEGLYEREQSTLLSLRLSFSKELDSLACVDLYGVFELVSRLLALAALDRASRGPLLALLSSLK